MSLLPAQLAAFIDHTLLKPDAGAKQIQRLCVEAVEHQFFSVCVNGSWVVAARDFLDGSEVKVVSTVGFPFGAMAGDVLIDGRNLFDPKAAAAAGLRYEGVGRS